VGEFEERSTIEELIKIEQELILHWMNLYKEILESYGVGVNLCPTRLAQGLRQDTWKELIEGRTIIGVTIPHPLHQFIHTWAVTRNHITCKGEHEFVEFCVSDKPNPHELITKRGPYPAFIGSTTREKVSGKIYMIPQASRPLRSAERIVQLSTWCV
jgi:hypothetical protein